MLQQLICSINNIIILNLYLKIANQLMFSSSKIKSLKDGAYQYDQSNKLGQGSFAKVYKGIITKNKRIVAIRLLPLKLIDQYGQKIKQIITGQVGVLKDLSLSQSEDSIFIMKIYDCFMTQNNVVMVLQYCPEGNLQDILKKGPLEQSKNLEIIYQIARGLEFIAKQKVVHRDIKPDNIFIKKQGNHRIFKIGDFGFAVKKQLNNQIVGTPIFMSPQLFRQERYGSEVDVWAFGLMIHYCLFKEYYFIASSEQKIKNKVLTERYELKKHHLSKISKQMADFLTLCLKFDKKQRIPAERISQHPVFNSVRQKIQQIIKDVIQISSTYESNLSKITVKGKISNQIAKYSFLIDLANAFSILNQLNYASLYILKHALGQLTAMKSKMQNKINFLEAPDWNSFCTSQDYEKTGRILKVIAQKCQEKFQMSFNHVMPAVRSNYGDQVANGIQQNLGKGPYDQIKTDAICYQLQNNWYKWIQHNKNPETHLLGLQMIIALHIYRNKPISVDFTTYEMRKKEMDLKSRTQFLETSISGSH